MDRYRTLSPRPARIALVAGLLVALTWPMADEAQARRRAPERDNPPPNLEYAPEEARCAPDYAAALHALFARATPQPLATARMVRTPMPEIRGRWLFHIDGDRRRQRDDMGRLVDGDRVCAEELSRGGRARCARWEQRPQSTEPIVPVPQPTRDETRIIGAVAEMVAHKGAPPEFLGNGRYTIMTERVATDLEGYALQEAHPAICSGGEELVDFLSEKLAPLKKRVGDVEDLKARSLEVIAPRVAALRAALEPPSVAAAAPQIAVTPPPPVLAVAAPGAAVPPPLPTTAAGWLADVAGLVLERSDAQSVIVEAAPLSGLRRMAELLAGGRSPAPPVARSQAKAALRMIEAAAYVELLSLRYRDLDQALFGTLDDVRKAHARFCTCGG